MENRAHALAAGLFALILGAGLVVALWWFSQERQPMRELVLVARSDVNGLGQQSRVRYRGLAVGNVTQIRIDPEDPLNILVRIQVAENLPITRGTRASLGSLGVTGLSFVQLDDRGTDPTPLTGVDGQLPRIELEAGLMSQVTDRALEAVEQFRSVATRISGAFDEDSAARFRETLVRLESAAAGMDRSFAEAPRTLEAVRSVFSAKNVARISATLANLERTSGEAAPAMAELRSLLVRVDQMAQRVDRAAASAGDSLIDGTLPQLNELLRDLTNTSRRLGRLIEEVETTPQLLLTGRAEHQPGPGEDGFDGGKP